MVEEYAARAKQINQQFLCVTDHGVMGSVPRQIRACEKNKINAIHGCELYVNPMQMELKLGESSGDFVKQMNEEDKPKFRKSYHLLGIAYNETGYSNLVNLSSAGWTNGFYYRPRVNHEQLLAHREGIIFTSCCYNSEIGQAFDKGGEDAGFAMIEKYMAMFGENFYLEMMLLDFSKQKPYDAFIVKAHYKYNIPVILTNDCHYCLKEDSKMQRLMLMVQTRTSLKQLQEKMAADEDGDLFQMQDPNLWMKSEEEINEKYRTSYSDVIPYELFKQAKLNTVAICEKAKGVQLDRSIKLPTFDSCDQRLAEAIEIGYKKRALPVSVPYQRRIQEEYSLITQKGFSSYFLIQKMMTDEARRISPILLGWGDGSEAVGPGRGSVCGSLIAYCLGITDVDPLKHDLLFSRFLSPARGGRSMKLKFSSDPIKQQVIQELQKPILLEDDSFFGAD
jgi:DNA polymerase-3 subunit alpha